MEGESEVFFNDFADIDEDDTILCFDEGDVEKTEADLRSMMDESKRNLQEMKEDAMNSVRFLWGLFSNDILFTSVSKNATDPYPALVNSPHSSRPFCKFCYKYPRLQTYS